MDNAILASSKRRGSRSVLLILASAVLTLVGFVSFSVASAEQGLNKEMLKACSFGSDLSIIEHSGFWIAAICAIIVGVNIVLFIRESKCSLVVTDNNIRGFSTFNKPVVLEYDTIMDIEQKGSSEISVCADSGIYKFVGIKNRDELFDVLADAWSAKWNANKANGADSGAKEVLEL